jgi:glycosyltransferase involved in cell wall biosynthesis
MNFAVAVIARNEEKTLPRLIKSLRNQGFTGNIYVLDTGSTDDTVGAAFKAGATHVVENTSFRKTITEREEEVCNNVLGDHILKEGQTYFDFAAARNYIVDEYVREPFVFMPDCDEFVTTEFCIDELNRIIAGGVDRIEYEFVYARNDDGSPNLQFRHHKFYNKHKFRWKGTVHEALVSECETQTHTIDAVLLEHGQNHETDRSNYLTGMLRDYVNSECDTRTLYYLGRELYYSGYNHAARAVLEQHVDQPEAWDMEVSESLILLSKIIQIPRYRLAHAFLAVNAAPNRRETWLRVLEVMREQNKWQDMEPILAALNSVKYRDFYMNQRSLYSDKVVMEWSYLIDYYTGDMSTASFTLRMLIKKYGIEAYRSDLQFFPDLQNEFK